MRIDRWEAIITCRGWSQGQGPASGRRRWGQGRPGTDSCWCCRQYKGSRRSERRNFRCRRWRSRQKQQSSRTCPELCGSHRSLPPLQNCEPHIRRPRPRDWPSHLHSQPCPGGRRAERRGTIPQLSASWTVRSTESAFWWGRERGEQKWTRFGWNKKNISCLLRPYKYIITLFHSLKIPRPFLLTLFQTASRWWRGQRWGRRSPCPGWCQWGSTPERRPPSWRAAAARQVSSPTAHTWCWCLRPSQPENSPLRCSILLYCRERYTVPSLSSYFRCLCSFIALWNETEKILWTFGRTQAEFCQQQHDTNYMLHSLSLYQEKISFCSNLLSFCWQSYHIYQINFFYALALQYLSNIYI